MVCLGDLKDENCRGLLRLLSVLLSSKMMPDDKKQILSGEFNIPMTQTLDREVASMCNLGHAVFVEGVEQGMNEGLAKGLAKGRSEGLAEGRREGRSKSLLAAARSIMEKLGLNLDEVELTPKGTIDKLMTYDDYIYDEAIKEKKAELYA